MVWGWYQQFVQEGQESFERFKRPETFDWEQAGVTSRAFMDVSINDEEPTRLVFELAEEHLPLTCLNFKRLCEGTNGDYSYVNTLFHRIIKGGAIMGGDVELKDGEGGHSSFDTRYIPDEGFVIPHDQRGLLSMASIGLNTGNSQFYLLLDRASQLDGRCVCFGRLVEGFEVLDVLEKDVFTTKEKPLNPVKVVAAGVL